MSEATTNTKIFKLTSFSPIGFKTMNYPVQFCSLCRGYLTDVCSTCMEKGCEKCDVINNDGSYYHNHCYTFMSGGPKAVAKPAPKGKKVQSDIDGEWGGEDS